MAVGFWDLESPSESTAIVNADGRIWTYAALRDAADRFAETQRRGRKTLGFLLCRNTPECLIAYLGALRGGMAVCVLDADISANALARIIEAYQPDWVFSLDPVALPDYSASEQSGGHLYRRTPSDSDIAIDESLAVLLPTSGSTGSPKLVRLSWNNLQSNAASIVSYLKIKPADRAVTSLPMAYSYGLSVLHTHLLAGAQVLTTTSGFLQREFWTAIQEHRPTSLAGVPYHYEVMLSRRLLDQSLPSIRTLTQAGGRLSPERIAKVHDIAERGGRRLFVMYGQTEATARIAFVPPEQLREKLGTIGIAIPHGRLCLDAETGELLYEGPNVMLGYAECRVDLSKGDELQGHLATGDIGQRDRDGFYSITGRLKRFVKIFGRRFNLDDIEAVVGKSIGASVACVGSDDRICVAVVGASEEAVTRVMHGTLKIHPSAFRVVRIDGIPRLANGKLDYHALTEHVQV